MKTTTYYIAFYKYEDSEIWQKTGLNTDKEKLEEYIKNVTYVNLKSINIKSIELPE